LTVVASGVSAATLATPYLGAIIATGGTAPYIFSLASGTLPAGLKLSPTGVITGTPMVVGTSNFTINVTGLQHSGWHRDRQRKTSWYP